MDTATPAVKFAHQDLTWNILACAFEVHRKLGPGLLEQAYSSCLEQELRLRDIPFQRQRTVGLDYMGIHVPNAFRADLIVAEAVVVEVKSVEVLAPVHMAQALTYLRLAGLHVGLLLNFNTADLRRGIKRLVL